MKKIIKAQLMLSIIVLTMSCQKNWLDAKPDKALVVPSTIADYQALLDNTDDLFTVNEPGIGELTSDYSFIPDQKWALLPTPVEKFSYIWDAEPYKGETGYDWNYAYSHISSANVILDGINKINQNPSNLQAWNNVKGSALFFRAFAYYNLTQEYCKPYNVITPSDDLGLPLRTSPIITTEVSRSTIKETFDLIFKDLKEAETLLPAIPGYKNRPSKPAAQALLARIYLSIEDYKNGLKYSDLVLKSNPQLIDYNTIDSTAYNIFEPFNTEVIMHSTLVNFTSMVYLNGAVDSNFYKSYSSDDLRKPLYFRKFRDLYRFWGNYSGHQNPYFNGLATDEVYLINAEAKTRTGAYQEAVTILNKFLENRWRTGTLQPVKYTTEVNLLTQIISERKKELIGRGLRWSDLRRLNKDSRFAITLTRTLNGTVYTLPPNDKRYTLPIPPDEIRRSGIQQN